VESTDALTSLVSSLPPYAKGEAYVMGVRASMDSITQG
jgi:hypothetical protein